MSALLFVFTLLALGLTLYILRFVQIELLSQALDYPRYVKALESSLDDPRRLRALAQDRTILSAAVLEASAHERGSFILRERGLQRRARFESALSRLRLFGTGALLAGLITAFYGLLRTGTPETLPLDRLADPSLGGADAELPLLALLAGFGVSIIARLGARMLQPRLHAQLAVYAQLVTLFEFRELQREQGEAHDRVSPETK